MFFQIVEKRLKTGGWKFDMGTIMCSIMFIVLAPSFVRGRNKSCEATDSSRCCNKKNSNEQIGGGPIHSARKISETPRACSDQGLRTIPVSINRRARSLEKTFAPSAFRCCEL